MLKKYIKLWCLSVVTIVMVLFLAKMAKQNLGVDSLSPSDRESVRSKAWANWVSIDVHQVVAVEISPVYESTSRSLRTVSYTVLVKDRSKLSLIFDEMRGKERRRDCFDATGKWYRCEKWSPDREFKMTWLLSDGRRTAFLVRFHHRLPIADYANFENPATVNSGDANIIDFASVRLYELLLASIPQDAEWLNANDLKERLLKANPE